LVVRLFGAFYSYPSEVHDCAFHTPDDPPGIVSDIHVPDKYLASACYVPGAVACLWQYEMLSFLMIVFEHFDKTRNYNTSDF